MKAIKDLIDGIWALGRSFVGMKQAVESLSYNVDKLSNKIDVIEGKLSGLGGRLDALEKVLVAVVDKA